MVLEESYDHLMIESEILPTDKWLFIHNPILIILITIGYLYFIFYAGPRYMKDRPSFKLKTFIMFYNAFQIFANILIVKEHIAAGWFTKYSIQCSSPSELNSSNTLHILNIMWWVFLLKLFDYIETCVFVLRKKQNQVTFLHVYHHVSVVFFAWYFLKYIADDRASLVTLVNCFVHVLMYTYYFLSGWSKELQQLSSFKSYITRLQMAQFIGLVLYFLQAFLPSCVVSKQIFHIVPIFTVNLLIYLGLFYNFYKKSYNKKKPKENKN